MGQGASLALKIVTFLFAAGAAVASVYSFVTFKGQPPDMQVLNVLLILTMVLIGIAALISFFSIFAGNRCPNVAALAKSQ